MHLALPGEIPNRVAVPQNKPVVVFISQSRDDPLASACSAAVLSTWNQVAGGSSGPRSHIAKHCPSVSKAKIYCFLFRRRFSKCDGTDPPRQNLPNEGDSTVMPHPFADMPALISDKSSRLASAA